MSEQENNPADFDMDKIAQLEPWDAVDALTDTESIIRYLEESAADTLAEPHPKDRELLLRVIDDAARALRKLTGLA